MRSEGMVMIEMFSLLYSAEVPRYFAFLAMSDPMCRTAFSYSGLQASQLTFDFLS